MLLSLFGFGHKPRGEGRSRSFYSVALCSFRFSVLATNREKGRSRSFYSVALATKRDVKEGRAPFTPGF